LLVELLVVVDVELFENSHELIELLCLYLALDQLLNADADRPIAINGTLIEVAVLCKSKGPPLVDEIRVHLLHDHTLIEVKTCAFEKALLVLLLSSYLRCLERYTCSKMLLSKSKDLTLHPLLTLVLVLLKSLPVDLRHMQTIELCFNKIL
jgi:hypothetical protein